MPTGKGREAFVKAKSVTRYHPCSVRDLVQFILGGDGPHLERDHGREPGGLSGFLAPVQGRGRCSGRLLGGEFPRGLLPSRTSRRLSVNTRTGTLSSSMQLHII